MAIVKLICAFASLLSYDNADNDSRIQLVYIISSAGAIGDYWGLAIDESFGPGNGIVICPLEAVLKQYPLLLSVLDPDGIYQV